MKPLLVHILPACFLGLAFAASPVSAQSTLAQYTFASGTTAAALASSDSDSATSATSISLSGLGTFGQTSTGHAISATSIGGQENANNLYVSHSAIINSATETLSDYFQFSLSLTDTTNYSSVSFSQLSLKAEQTKAADSTISASASVTFFLRTSADNYASTLGSQTITGPQAPPSSYNTYTFDLSSLSSITGTTVFRVYLYDANDTNNKAGDGIRFDDVSLRGSLAPIPEPSAFAALAGLFTLGRVMYRRRNRA